MAIEAHVRSAIRTERAPRTADVAIAAAPRCPGRRRTQAIRRVLDEDRETGEARARSDLERQLLSLLDAHGSAARASKGETKHGELDATWRQLTTEPETIATQLRIRLAQAPAPAAAARSPSAATAAARPVRTAPSM